MHARPAVALASLVLLLAAGCGKDDNSAESTPSATISASPSASPSPSETSSPSASPSETSSPSGSPSASPTGSSSSSASSSEDTVAIDIDLVAGKPKERPEAVVEVEKGQTVKLTVSSDKEYEIHIHGYDKKIEVPAGGEESVEFEADKTGTWEVEVEDTGFKLFDLRVT